MGIPAGTRALQAVVDTMSVRVLTARLSRTSQRRMPRASATCAWTVPKPVSLLVAQISVLCILWVELVFQANDHAIFYE